MSRILIVGGGPVGLWLALQLKYRSCDAHVVVWERHSTYKRVHTLQLTPDAFEHSAMPTERLHHWFPKATSGTSRVTTSTLETLLRADAMRLGVDIRLIMATSRQQILDAVHVEGFNCVIGADGAKSKMRDWFFKGMPSDNTTALLQHGALVAETVSVAQAFAAHLQKPTAAVSSPLSTNSSRTNVSTSISVSPPTLPVNTTEKHYLTSSSYFATTAMEQARNWLKPPEFRVYRLIQHALEIKYTVHKAPLSPLDMTLHAYPTLKVIGHLLQEIISANRDNPNHTDVTLRINVSADEYAPLAAFKAGNPLYLSTWVLAASDISASQLQHHHQHITTTPSLNEVTSLVPNSILHALRVWMNARFCFNGDDQIDATTVRVSSVELNAYLAQQTTQSSVNGRVTYHLVGDAACGVPFFRSLNTGWHAASYLAKWMHSECIRQDAMLHPASMSWTSRLTAKFKHHTMLSYENYMYRLGMTEIAKAESKKIGLQALHLWLQVSEGSSFDVVKLCDCELRFVETSRLSGLTIQRDKLSPLPSKVHCTCGRFVRSSVELSRAIVASVSTSTSSILSTKGKYKIGALSI